MNITTEQKTTSIASLDAEIILDLTSTSTNSPTPPTPAKLNSLQEEKSQLVPPSPVVTCSKAKPLKASSPDEWPNTCDGYMLGAKIGSGAFAVVHHAKRTKDKQDCAMKIIRLDELTEDTDNEQLMDEINMMRSLKHDNVLSIHASFNVRRNHGKLFQSNYKKIKILIVIMQFHFMFWTKMF
tara:strand:- start:239 stop:784 length:546 start_codon:yes stop_codon:yes gene_type:complete